MTLVMYDSINPDQFHGLTMDAAAGYVDGQWPTYPTLGQHVPPGTKLVSISVFGNPADCIDVEPGNVTNDQGAVWTRDRINAGHWRPIVYTGAANARDMLRTLTSYGVTRQQIRLWTAHYVHHEHFCAPDTCNYVDEQADGTQWTDVAHGRNLDQSVLMAGFFQASAPPKPTASEDDPMVCAFVNTFNGNTETFEVNAKGGLYLRSRNPTGGWSAARFLSDGFTGSASYAIRKDGIDVFVELAAGGVIAYVFDPAHPGWTRQSLTAGVQ